MIENLKELISYKSVYDTDELPFGSENIKVLKKALEIGESYGFKTKNLDNYCGYMEIGEGEEIIGIVGHLDVVPAGEGWNTDPYTLTKIDDKLYGRGTSDDKGAVAASIEAMKQIKESGIKLNKRIRLIVGCNEESGSKCMEYYNAHEEGITYGFTPDADFPCIHGEKGMMYGKFISKSDHIKNIYGGTVSNAVCQKCTIELDEFNFDFDIFKNNLEENGLKYFVNGNAITVEGVAAHASTPEKGKNAISYMMYALNEAGFEDNFVKYYNEMFGLFYDGYKFGINVEDKYGALTFNIGVISMKDGNIEGTIDIRFPVTMKSRDILELCKEKMEKANGKVIFEEIEEPLFYEIDSPLVETLYDAYVEVTDDNSLKPLVIGGGTYAKSIKNVIAFGCEFPGSDNHIHDANEFVYEEELYKQVKLYKCAILKFLEL